MAANEAASQKPVVVVPNWNGADQLRDCLDSLQAQTLQAHIIVVDNGSRDESLNIIRSFDSIELIQHNKNKGYAGGVNPGFQRAIDLGASYVATFNNDAIADKYWLKRLVDHLEAHPKVGIATCKLLSGNGDRIDSTGEFFTIWGLPYSRGRGEPAETRYDGDEPVFAASGGASLFRVSMLRDIGLFDEDFFAYYEDVDLSFRAQLAGWTVAYVPDAEVNHKTGTTSSKMPGFVTYQAFKNMPWVISKNMPARHIWPVLWRFAIAYFGFLVSAVGRGQGWSAIKGIIVSLWLLPKKLVERQRIQKNRAAKDDYIWRMLIHDLPPNAHALRKLRNFYWQVTFRKTHE